MKVLMSLGLLLALSPLAGTLEAGELKSGLQPGEMIGAYIVEKCAGNPHDGVKDGAKLCYRCKMGNRPVVAVFAHDADDNLVSLMKKLDAVVTKHKDKKLAAYVNLLGKDAEKAKTRAKQLVKKAGTDDVAVVVPVDLPNGPASLKLSPQAELTVLIFSKGKIVANHSFGENQFDESKIAAIVTDAKTMVK